MRYLQEKQYYDDLYDLFTIKECLGFYWDMMDSFDEKRGAKEFKKYTNKEFDKEVRKVVSITVNVIAGERYRRKVETIEEWIRNDKETQDIYDSAEPPIGVMCKHYGSSKLEVTTKDFFNRFDEKPKIVFMFKCSSCSRRQAHYDDGTPWKYKKPLCPKCNAELDSKSTHTEDTSATIESCPKCLYQNKDVFDFKKSAEERKKKDKQDKFLLKKYRKEFCWTDEQGHQYMRTVDNLRRMKDEHTEEEKKAQDPRYQKARKLKKLTVVELKKLLSDQLEKEKFVELKLGEPDMGKFVIVPFTVQEADPDRKGRASQADLSRLMRKVLMKTNWRLMSDGVSYRMGYLSGRLKGYEREGDLVSLFKAQK